GDYDSDGRCDIYLCNLNGRSRLYRNLGDWKFEDATESAGLHQIEPFARAAVFADIAGDSALDLLVTYSGKGVRLFLNDGNGHFRAAQTPELMDRTGSKSMALGDLTGSGRLDLYVVNYGERTVKDGGNLATRIVAGKEHFVGRFRD